MRRLTIVLAGLAFALLVVGLALYPMLQPTFTRVLEQQYGQAHMAGLSPQRMLAVAEQVREFVAENDAASLPASVDGRPGFDSAAVSHLRDVRRVLAGARTFTGVLAALVVVWLAVEIVRGSLRTISSALLLGAALCAVFVVVGALAGLINFDALFAWFHGLFFAAGTWEFPADSLLIEAFPDGFWVAAGVAWAALVAAGGLVLALAGWLVRRAETREHGTASAGNP